jgi:hypothetical protein
MVISAVGLTKNDHDVVAVDNLTPHAAPGEIATALVTAGCPPTRPAVAQDDLETCFLGLVRR